MNLFNNYLKLSKKDEILNEIIKLYIEWKDTNNNNAIFENLTVSYI